MRHSSVVVVAAASYGETAKTLSAWASISSASVESPSIAFLISVFFRSINPPHSSLETFL